ncbi:MAG: YihY/virulence factor BrkB family protein [Rhodothermales bacterium]
MPSLRESIDLLKQTGKEIGEDNCTSMSAAIAYYTLFSLPPLLVILVGIAGAVFGADAVQEQLTGQVGGLVGESGAAEVQTMIENAGDLGGGSIIGKVLGLLALVFGATGAFAQLQQSLNRAWEVRPDPDSSGLKNMITKRVLSFGMVLTIAFLLVVSLAASALMSGLFTVMESVLGPAGAPLAWVGELVLSLGIFTLLFAAIFRVLPDAEVAWRDVWVGAFATAVLFVVGKFLIGFYLGRSNPGEAFGAAGSVVVILVWIYYTALILLAGAEFTQLWAKRYGSQIEPADDAVRVIEEERVVDEDAPRSADDERDERPAGAVPHPYAEPREPEPRSGWNPEA